MRIADLLLLEDRVDFLRNRYLPVIRQRMGSFRIPADIRSQIARLPGATPEERIFNWLASLDPTTNRQYLQWILTCAADRAVPFEDLEHLPETLAKYHQRKRTNTLPAEARDINRIRTPSQLDVLLGEIRGRETAVSAKEEQQARRKSQVLLDDDQWLVLIPKTPFAAKFYGRGTQWCTAWGDPHGLHPKRRCRFNQYNRNSPLIIAINKADPGERYQFHRASEQYMDRNDQPVDPADLVRMGRANPALARVLISHVPVMAAAFGNEKQQLAAVEQNPFAIQIINNPTEDVQLAAVEQNPFAIHYIKNPTEAVQLAAVQQNGLVIRLINNPSEAVQLAAVRKYGGAIQYIRNPSEAVQLAAVQQSGEAIRLIKNPTEAVQLAAVQQSGEAIRWIKKPTEAVQLEVVRQHGEAIRWINKPSPAAIELARRQGYSRWGLPIR